MIVVYVTFPSIEGAKKVSKTLLTEKLIACVTFHKVESMYSWDNELQEEKEVLALMKTTEGKFAEVQKRVASLHSHLVPCVMKFSTEATKSFTEWVEKEVQ